MKLALQLNGNETVVKMKGVNKFYVLNHEEVYSTISLQLESSVNIVKLDLKSIQYIDSSAFNTLIKLHRYAKELDKKLIMSNVSKDAMALFDILKLRDVLNFDTTEGSGIEAKETISA